MNDELLGRNCCQQAFRLTIRAHWRAQPLESDRAECQIHGMKITYEAPFLRHFTAKLEPEPRKWQPPRTLIVRTLIVCLTRGDDSLRRERKKFSYLRKRLPRRQFPQNALSLPLQDMYRQPRWLRLVLCRSRLALDVLFRRMAGQFA